MTAYSSRLVLFSVLLLEIAACRGDSPEGGTHTVTDSAGVRIVESLSPAWGQAGARIDSIPTLRIGKEEAGPYQFGLVAEARFLADGTFAVPELTAGEIRIFDSSGHHVRTLGRRGAGPGEFQMPYGLFEYPGDSVAVFDQRLRRTTIFSQVPGSPRTLQNEVEGNFVVFGFLEDSGTFLLRNMGGGYRPDLPPGLQWTMTDVVAMDAVDGSSQIIAQLPSRQQWVEPGGDTRILEPQHWGIPAAADNGFYWLQTDRYEIAFYEGQGRLRRILRRPVQPRAVEPAMVEEYVEIQLEFVRRNEGEARVPDYRRRYEEATYGEDLPFFGAAFVDRDQRLWVSESPWPNANSEPRRWTLFSREGNWLTDVIAPENVKIVDSDGDVVLGIARDALDVPYVQLHRIIRP